jgi:hypothetical protein
VVDGPLGVDQPPAVVFPSQTRSQHLPPSRAATRATGTPVTAPGISTSDRNKTISLAMRDNLWISRADGSVPPHVHKDVGAAWRSADSTPIRKLGDSTGTCLVMSTSAERQRSFPHAGSQGRPDDQGNRRRVRRSSPGSDGDGVVWRVQEVDVARTLVDTVILGFGAIIKRAGASTPWCGLPAASADEFHRP